MKVILECTCGGKAVFEPQSPATLGNQANLIAPNTETVDKERAAVVDCFYVWMHNHQKCLNYANPESSTPLSVVQGIPTR